MKLGVFTVLLRHLPFERMLDTLADLGVEAVEIGTGNYPGSQHCDPDELLADRSKADAFRKAVDSRGMIVSALSQHGNPLHPQREIAQASHEVWRKTVVLAEQLEVPVVNAFSGCPGDSDGSRYPNWATCAWPDDFQTVLEWQWNEKVIPYWTTEAAYAEDHGVKIGFEMHPGFVVYNTETLLKLRAACGDAVGANLDPSHLFWQGMDPVEVIKVLGNEDAIFHVHAKDTQIDKRNTAINGVLDTKHYGQLLDRSWVFRTVGYGQGEKAWRDIISTLRATGYDYVLSIEHEDSYLSIAEGLRRGVQTLQSILITEPIGQMWWA
jgi:sugar phosphate isomerase/epimerase